MPAGKVRVMVSGASPLSPEVMDFLRICFPGSTILEGYGMTESSCTIAVSALEDTQAGNVGPPVRCNEVKLADVPEMSYTNADQPYPRGEVRARAEREARREVEDCNRGSELLAFQCNGLSRPQPLSCSAKLSHLVQEGHAPAERCSSTGCIGDYSADLLGSLCHVMRFQM